MENPFGTPDFASTLTVTLPENVSTGPYKLTVTGSGGELSHVANLALTVSPSTQTSSDLMHMIQQNQLPIFGGIVLLAAVLVAVACGVDENQLRRMNRNGLLRKMWNTKPRGQQLLQKMRHKPMITNHSMG